jgi:hypothetical protein
MEREQEAPITSSTYEIRDPITKRPRSQSTSTFQM